MRHAGFYCIFEANQFPAMKQTYILYMLAALLLCACNGQQPLYSKLSDKAYARHKAQDTIINTPKLLVTCTGSAAAYNNMDTVLVRRQLEDGYHYFKLAADVYFENSTTLIEYEGFFSSGEDGPFQKNGIWVYTDFYKNLEGKGMNFAVDSLPEGYTGYRPGGEGIYYYKNHRLTRVSRSQSEASFEALNKDGFYFIPNSGRFFKRHSVAVLQ